MALVIERVGSAAAAGGVQAGDTILAVNGHRVRDELEYRFYSGEETVALEIRRPGVPRPLTRTITRAQSRGLVFAPPVPIRCSNHCIFCFVDQLPEGLRPSLYVKDEDYRLSFLNGTFVTFSAISETSLQKICSMRLSPLYVSVHATDPKVRNRMLGRSESRDILETIRTLTRAGIVLHAQVVLCPGINDGEVLSRTIDDLSRFFPGVASVAVVPVGLTKYRKEKGLYPLRPATRQYSIALIREVERIQAACRAACGSTFVYLSDEFYIKAGRRFPPYACYGDFPQLENGVGMIPLFEHSWKRKSRTAGRRPLRGRKVLVVTGTLAYPHIAEYLRHLMETRGVNVRPIAVRNRFFGPRVTVAGLLTARDIIETLEPTIRQGSVVLVPDVMLKDGEDLFLDDVSLPELAEALGAEVKKVPSYPEAFERVLERVALGAYR